MSSRRRGRKRRFGAARSRWLGPREPAAVFCLAVAMTFGSGRSPSLPTALASAGRKPNRQAPSAGDRRAWSHDPRLPICSTVPPRACGMDEELPRSSSRRRVSVAKPRSSPSHRVDAPSSCMGSLSTDAASEVSRHAADQFLVAPRLLVAPARRSRRPLPLRARVSLRTDRPACRPNASANWSAKLRRKATRRGGARRDLAPCQGSSGA